ncbi:hypothetical protein Harman_41670 [Haloarcula mannanilytica]|uniref:Type IV secretion system coupling protein TraD DNA-binding domain-containing protein n=1 Tax=Haloarcula mannanilytica TaxID=2509225 RepID=A0A4C2EPP0_9EURY|nr:hypothetical protein [Haloarcula mannanilytica]GCF16232.1 hypothetical protein Harman_41670 [Haloarcula mannanilytica]
MKPEDTLELIENCGGKEVTYVGTKTSILGAEKNVYIEDRHRAKHALTTGVNGTGKTHELLHVALQDSVKDRGFAIFNSKGTVIDQFLAKVPENRYDDLVYVNPYREPITGINVLEPYLDQTVPTAAKTNRIELIVSNLIQLFKRLSTNWGDRFGRVLTTLLRAGVEANIEHRAGYTLIDIKNCVTDNEELKQLIDDTKDPELRSQLVTIKDDLSDSQLEPLVRRLNDFTENKTVRHIVGSETRAVVNHQT